MTGITAFHNLLSVKRLTFFAAVNYIDFNRINYTIEPDQPLPNNP